MLILILVSLFFLFLIVEQAVHRRRLDRIPLRVCITGTRGKSTVTRQLASVLRENGRRVLAKTTGSEARLILPDGSEEEVRRRGLPSIREQKALIRRAVSEKADCLVVEMMSIQPENQWVEAHQLLRPSLVGITNVRLDHTEAMGVRREQIAAAFALSIPPAADAFLPVAAAAQFPVPDGVRIHPISSGAGEELRQVDTRLPQQEFSTDLDLVWSLARHLGVSGTTIARGIARARQDRGRFRIWTLRFQERTCYLVNAFAANDPESTFAALERTVLSIADHRGVYGILNLRRDRPVRTLQWIDQLRCGDPARFARLYVTGGHARVCRRKVPAATLLLAHSAEGIMAEVTPEMPDQGILFGFGNMAGAGRRLVDLWALKGTPHGV